MARTIKAKGKTLNVLQYTKLEIVLVGIDEGDPDVRLDESDVIGDLEHGIKDLVNDLGYECSRVELS